MDGGLAGTQRCFGTGSWALHGRWSVDCGLCECANVGRDEVYPRLGTGTTHSLGSSIHHRSRSSTSKGCSSWPYGVQLRCWLRNVRISVLSLLPHYLGDDLTCISVPLGLGTVLISPRI
jgi:hypothetical protein